MEADLHEKTTLEGLAQVFLCDPRDVHVLHRGEGLVIESTRDGKAVIIKVVAQDEASMQSQLDWVDYVREGGIQVPDLILSRHGKRVEILALGNAPVVAYAYWKIPLGPENIIRWEEDASLPFRLGAVMGRMHCLAKAYQSPAGYRAADWDEVDWLQKPAQVLHPSQGAVVEAIERVKAEISLYPRDASSYGLIHDDLHTGNVFRSGEDLIIIDFDLLHQSWFSADLASALLFRVWIGPQKDAPEMRDAASVFLTGLCNGYRTQQDLPPDWLDMLPVFLKLREISLFQSFYRDVNLADRLDDAFFRYVYENIRLSRAFLPIDYQTMG